MTQDEIIQRPKGLEQDEVLRMAREAGFEIVDSELRLYFDGSKALLKPNYMGTVVDGLKKFAALVAAHEREEQSRLVEIIEHLWNIIDDIDTYGDMAKADDKLYRGLVERRQNDRWKTGITTDGYTLTIPDVAVSIEAAAIRSRSSEH